MEDHNVNTTVDVAVLFLIFNRPGTTALVFDQLRKAKPSRLYIAADGPRNKEDELKVKQCREIVSHIDWECEVKTKFSEINLNCGKGPYEAIQWFFQHEEMGIILEDDCLPAISFFRYCKELLDVYKTDTRVMMISGDNFVDGCSGDPDYSYYFSNFNLSWGWATWRRAWDLYDFTMKNYNEVLKKGYFDHVFINMLDKKYRLTKLQRTFDKGPNIDWWDYQWQYTLLTQSGYCIVPEVNLIKNIGFNAEATHTTNNLDKNGNVPTCEINFPLRHPRFVIRNVDEDKRLLNFFIKSKLKARLSKIWPIGA